MEDVCEKICVFEDSAEIDLDFEFDVAKYFDFTRSETPEEVKESESWFDCAQGHPPSPLVEKFDWRTDEGDESETSSSMYEHQSTHSTNNDSDLDGSSEASSLGQGKTGQEKLKSKPRISRLLKPTASQLAKQNQQICVQPTRDPGRVQKLSSPLKSPGENVASKRQKLELNYLRKVAQLKHQASYSHKLPRKGRTTDISSPARPKVTIPKEPALATAQRARHRSNDVPQPGKQSGNHSRSNSCSTNPSFQEKSESVYKFRARPLNKKIFSSKGELGVFRPSKREATVPREFKLSNSKKLSQSPLVELFSKLSFNPENHPGSLPKEKQSLQTKGFKKKRTCSTMKENKFVACH